jgi:hypothetical protein
MSFKSKFTIAFMIVLIIGMPMLLKGPDGRPIMSLDDWVPDIPDVSIPQPSLESVDSLTSMIERESDDETSVAEPEPVVPAVVGNKMYKWQDKNGRWHFSSEKPTDQQQVSVEKLPDVENVMEAPVTQDKKSSTISLPGGFGLSGG